MPMPLKTFCPFIFTRLVASLLAAGIAWFITKLPILTSAGGMSSKKNLPASVETAQWAAKMAL